MKICEASLAHCLQATACFPPSLLICATWLHSSDIIPSMTIAIPE